ncbi:MAG TPA: hypothetical protein VGP42_05165 [Stellaceae bacterium]|jgi:hypothetical protein|nr:hypothetical protein [Stellaceae bacterium]
MLIETLDLLTLEMASRLTGLSPACVKEAFVATGMVEYRPDPSRPDGRFYIDRISLERAVGRPFTSDEYRAADRALAPRRIQQKEHRRMTPMPYGANRVVDIHLQ